MITMTMKADFREAYAALDNFERKMQTQLLAKAVRQAFKPVLAAARRMAPMDTGLLRKRIKMSVIKTKDVIVVGLRLGTTPETLKGKSKPEARNWSWYEIGVPAHGIPAKPFFRPALDANKDTVLNLLKQELMKQIEEATRKGAASGDNAD